MSYTFSGGIGHWTNSSSNLPQFEYDYGTVSGMRKARLGSGNIGANWLSASFVGDGNRHQLDGTWSYEFREWSRLLDEFESHPTCV